MFRRARLTIARSLERLAYTGDKYTSDNIAHFVLDAVVRGDFAQTFAGVAEDEIGFSASRLPYCNHFRSVAFPGARVLEWGRAYHVESLYVFVHLHHPAQAVFRPALDFLSGLGAAAAGRPLGPCLYVSRRDRARRRLVNEAELEARLAELGFRIVVAGELAPEDQVAAFRDAAIVVAPHGAALTNALFMSPGARLVELFAPEGGTLALLAIAKSRGVAHEFFIGEAVDAEGGTWSVDVDAVNARLHHLLDRPASAAIGTEVADAPAR
jgi:capsular polysaccharide biosynthesis protein